MMRKIRIGQIGIGHNHGEAKMLAVQKFPELFEVVGYAEESEEWIKKRGDLPAYRDLKRFSEEELIEACDALLIETDVWDLTKTAQKCIDAGKSIHLDKPASGTLAEYKHLLDTAKEKDLVVQLGYMYRYNPALMLCKSMIQQGKLGEIYQIDAEMSKWHSARYRTWIGNFKGGAMYIFGSHLIDLVIDMLGEPIGVYPFIKQTGFEGAYSDDNDFLVLEYEKAVARITTLLVEANGVAMRRFAVMGSGGTIEIKPMEFGVRMAFYTPDGKQEALPVQDVSAECRYDEMMQDFYAYIMREKENPYSYDHDFAVQKVLYQAIGCE